MAASAADRLAKLRSGVDDLRQLAWHESMLCQDVQQGQGMLQGLADKMLNLLEETA